MLNIGKTSVCAFIKRVGVRNWFSLVKIIFSLSVSVSLYTHIICIYIHTQYIHTYMHVHKCTYIEAKSVRDTLNQFTVVGTVGCPL